MLGAVVRLVADMLVVSSVSLLACYGACDLYAGKEQPDPVNI